MAYEGKARLLMLTLTLSEPIVHKACHSQLSTPSLDSDFSFVAGFVLGTNFTITTGRAGTIGGAIGVTTAAGIGVAIIANFKLGAVLAIATSGTITSSRTIRIASSASIGIAIITSF